MKLQYRQGVIGVFTNKEGMVLVCERSREAGFWQFPQGGIDETEDEDRAIVREMSEELGTSDFQIVAKSKRKTVYDFPEDLRLGIASKFRGQEHRWYQLVLLGNAQPDLEQGDGEFQDFKWIEPSKVPPLVINWKRKAYTEGLKELRLISG